MGRLNGCQLHMVVNLKPSDFVFDTGRNQRGERWTEVLGERQTVLQVIFPLALMGSFDIHSRSF